MPMAERRKELPRTAHRIESHAIGEIDLINVTSRNEIVDLAQRCVVLCAGDRWRVVLRDRLSISGRNGKGNWEGLIVQTEPTQLIAGVPQQWPQLLFQGIPGLVAKKASCLSSCADVSINLRQRSGQLCWTVGAENSKGTAIHAPPRPLAQQDKSGLGGELRQGPGFDFGIDGFNGA